MKKIILNLVIQFLTFNLIAQNAESLEFIKSSTNIEALKKYSEKAKNEAYENRKKAHELAERYRWFIQSIDESQVFELQGLDARDMPLYYSTNNLDAARTTSTIKLWPNRALGLNLTGLGLKLGEWDGGRVRTTHRELIGRVIQRDGSTTTYNHASHVAGTMIASGIDSLARGMAWQANLDAYDWNYDVAEMSVSASEGLLLSNHSYVHYAGWQQIGSNWYWYGDTTISSTKDWKFGFYDLTSKQYDYISYNAPYYLIVKAAGNENGQGPNAGTPHYVWNGNNWVLTTTTRPKDGEFDCLPTFSVAKNILTVGNVSDLVNGYSNPAGVILSSSSSRGPTDDGRIKPDICGNGTSLYSTISTNDSAYGLNSGTSMAAPNITGSLALFQQHFFNKYNRFMKSATLKALAIHTADETGSANGPDYRFGWGLLNSVNAVQTISNCDSLSLIKELSLNNNSIYQYKVYSQGNVPLSATITWTDPESEPISPTLDASTPMLINDLDIRIIRNDTIWYPWILNPDSLLNAAKTGDNFRDNVEKVWIQNPNVGEYNIVVSHKGSLKFFKQDFSLIVTGIILDAPKDFIAYAKSSDSVLLKWKNNSQETYMIAWSDSSKIGQPANGNAYSNGQYLTGGGQVLYIGTDTSIYHTNLFGNKKYYYHIWKIGGGYQYSMPAIADGQTYCSSVELPYSLNFSENILPICINQYNLKAFNKWYLSNTSIAGGNSKEVIRTWEDVYGSLGGYGNVSSISRFILPPINTLGKNQVKLKFKSFYKDHQGWGGNGAIIRVQSSYDGLNWNNEAFSHVSGSGDKISSDTIISITYNLDKKSTYLSFTIEGNLFHIWYWAIDDIEVYEPQKPFVVKAYLEGIYENSKLKKVWGENAVYFDSDTADLITVELRDTADFSQKFISPNNTSIDTNGFIKMKVRVSLNQQYYIVLKHRNHIETWSAVPIVFSNDSIYYDFTTLGNNAYGNNMKQIESGKFALFVGDVNQDGVVDITDLVDMDIDLTNGSSGYIVYDLNGDGVVDISDLVTIDQNLTNGEMVITPF